MRQLALTGAIQAGHVEIVQVLKIVREIGHHAGLLVNVESVHGALATSDRGDGTGGEVDTKDLRGALESGFETQVVRAGSPVESNGNQVEIVHHQAGWRTALGISHVELRKLAASGPAGENNPLAVRRPTREIVFKRVVGNFGERAARSRNHPHVGVMAVIVFVAGPIRHKCNVCAIRRPLRIGIVPVVTRRDLLILARSRIHYPQMAALVVVPTRVIELIQDVPVMADIAPVGVAWDLIAGTNAADGDEALPVRRPLKHRNAVFQMARHLRFSAIHIEDADLWAGGFGWCTRATRSRLRGFNIAGRKKGQP